MISYGKLAITWMTLMVSAAAAYSADRVDFGTYTPDQFQDYWYHRGAEISRFALQQARYGEMHAGDAVLVFVTEPMNPKIQVKADHARPDTIPILKLNAIRKFFTGIYPYSVMTSIFTPVNILEHPLPLKITTSVQEWCGHVYIQMNLQDDAYRVRLHSYFEREADQDFAIENHVTEDAVWNMLRIAPRNLPRGTFAMIPGTVYARLAHRPITPQKAVAALETAKGKSLEGHSLARYTIHLPEDKRILRILFEKDFPYRIQQWEDTHPVFAGSREGVLTTRATRTHTIMSAYWQHHDNKDRALLDKLGLGAREMGKN
jgi:hypothetical protein